MVSASVIGIETVGVAQLKDTARQLIEKATRFVQYIGYRYKNTLVIMKEISLTRVFTYFTSSMLSILYGS